MLQNYHQSPHHRSSALHHSSSSAITLSKTNNKKFSYEDEEQANKKLQLTTTDLFLWKAQKTNEEIEATFQLINLPESHTPAGKVNLQHLQRLDFPVLKYQVQELVEFSIKMLRTTQFCTLNFTQRVTQRLISLLAKNYNPVAYHNFSHAFYFTMVPTPSFSSSINASNANSPSNIFVRTRSISTSQSLDFLMISITVHPSRCRRFYQ